MRMRSSGIPSADCDKRFRQPGDFLFVNEGARKKSAEPAAGEQLNGLHLCPGGGGVSDSPVPAHVEMIHHPCADRDWEVLEPRKQKMRLEGKALVRRLHEIPFADSLNLVCHAPLRGIVADMLDDRVREHDVEASRCELRNEPGVSNGAQETR